MPVCPRTYHPQVIGFLNLNGEKNYFMVETFCSHVRFPQRAIKYGGLSHRLVLLIGLLTDLDSEDV